MTGNVSDKCYVYFDIVPPPTIADFCNSGDTLTTCVKNLGNQGSEISNIYIHNSSLENGAGDNSYRYAGASESVNNFVGFGSTATPCPDAKLFRIIGVFGGQVKLIKYDYATGALLGADGEWSSMLFSNTYTTYKGDLGAVDVYYWNYISTQTNTWSESNLNKINLNTNFITNIGTEWANKIATTTWKVGGNTSANIRDVTPSVAYQNEIVNPVTTNTTDNATEYNAKIGLMYVSDYYYAAGPSAWTLVGYNSDSAKDYRTATSANWMYMGLSEWTISRSVSGLENVFLVDYSGGVGSVLSGGRCAVRPTFNLLSSITYAGGSGTSSDAIRIN